MTENSRLGRQEKSRKRPPRQKKGGGAWEKIKTTRKSHREKIIYEKRGLNGAIPRE